MSQENVELVDRFVVALNERAIPDDLLAPEFLMVNAETAVTGGSFHGASGVIQWTHDIFDPMDADACLSVEQIVAAEGDFVVAAVGLTGKGARFGLPVDFRWAAVFTCSEGKLTRVAGYLQLGEALEAAGLAE
jgi:ketosteroid isomerase-like protein